MTTTTTTSDDKTVEQQQHQNDDTAAAAGEQHVLKDISSATAAAAAPEQQQQQEDWKLQRDASKQLGDAAFRSQDYKTAIQHYSAALSLDPDFAVVLSNRSAAYLHCSEKIKALQDAQACVALKTMGRKGIGRLAAALQSLGRYEKALIEWNKVLHQDPNNHAALQGVQDCQTAIEKQQKDNVPESDDDNNKKAGNDDDDDVDDLDDFFNDVETAASNVVKEKERLAAENDQNQKPTNAIKNHKKDLGTAHSQIERLLSDNYRWRNLNPFHVLDLPHTATSDDISRRYKALSLLLHPDKNQNEERVQEAYDQVLKAKAMLDDENKKNHTVQLIEQGMKQGQAEWKQQQQQQQGGKKSNDDETLDLESFQSRAVQRIFAQVEQTRREVEKRERNQEQRERQQEEQELEKERKERKFNKEWKQEERVEKRIGNWRDFQQKKKKKSKV